MYGLKSEKGHHATYRDKYDGGRQIEGVDIAHCDQQALAITCSGGYRGTDKTCNTLQQNTVSAPLAQ